MVSRARGTTFRLAGSLSESQPISTNPFNKYGLPRKRDDKLKRCGKVLVKFVMQVCDYCITPSNTKQVDVSSRRKRQAGEMDEITEACCKRPCSAADVSVFCCANQR
uniref:Insulin-like domain-containing protein n=1 Tax=Acrobeloides nanus TaxID=290746 RepID=A0A914EN85_9BILA